MYYKVINYLFELNKNYDLAKIDINIFDDSNLLEIQYNYKTIKTFNFNVNWFDSFCNLLFLFDGFKNIWVWKYVEVL